MRSEYEIRCKIDELFNRLHYVEEHSFEIGGGARAEELRCNIDALLWVIGDRSGKSI